MQLLVLGAGRSGTSLVTGLLARMGCHLGSPEALLKADGANPRGYWERRDVVVLNSQILTAAGGDWDRLAHFDLDRLSAARGRRLGARAAAIVRDLDDHRPWALKDPRLCLVLPLWLPYLERPVCLLVHRRPMQVARSLQRAFQVPISIGLALWERYTLGALAESRELPRLLLAHRRFLTAPEEAVASLHRQLSDLGVEGLRIPPAEEIAAFVDRGLYRAREAAAEEKRYLTPPQRELNARLEDGSALVLREVPPLSPLAADILATYTDGLERLGVLKRELAERKRADGC